MKLVIKRFRRLSKDDIGALIVIWAVMNICWVVGYAITGSILAIPIGIALGLVLLIADGQL